MEAKGPFRDRSGSFHCLQVASKLSPKAFIVRLFYIFPSSADMIPSLPMLSQMLTARNVASDCWWDSPYAPGCISASFHIYVDVISVGGLAHLATVLRE